MKLQLRSLTMIVSILNLLVFLCYTLFSIDLFTVAVIGFSPSVYTVIENGSSVVLNVVNINTLLGRDVVVQVATVSGSADDGMIIYYLRKFMCSPDYDSSFNLTPLYILS